VPDNWISVADYGDRISAEAVLGLLARDDVPCYIASNEHVPGLGSAFSVRVPALLLEQARSVLKQDAVSDAELTELALREALEGSADG
jgi:hypothetical protein